MLVPELLAHSVDRVAILRRVDHHDEDLLALHRHIFSAPPDSGPHISKDPRVQVRLVHRLDAGHIAGLGPDHEIGVPLSVLPGSGTPSPPRS